MRPWRFRKYSGDSDIAIDFYEQCARIMRDLEQARINLDHALARNPENLETYVYLAALYVAARNDNEAAWKAEEIRALQPGFSVRDWLQTYPMSDPAQVAKLEQALTKLGL